MILTTLNFDYEVRPAEAAFKSIPAPEINGEMQELGRHIIKTKMGEFDPATFGDRYEAALQELVRAKIKSRRIKPGPAERREKVVDIMEALRARAKPGSGRGGKTPPKRKAS